MSTKNILNSGAVAADYISTEHPCANVYVVGEAPLIAELDDRDVHVTDNPGETDIVLLSWDRSFEYDDLVDILDASTDSDITIYATNPDRTCPVEDGVIPDCGAIIGAVEGMLGQEIDRVLGKPSPVTVDIALQRLDVDPEACLMVGDRLGTDIAMGKTAGLQTALVCSGVTDRDDVSDANVNPEYVLESLAEIDKVLSDGAPEV